MSDHFTKKHLLLVIIVGVLMVIMQQIYSFIFTDDIFVMCDIGQGDGMYLRINTIDIVIDAGRGPKMATCLSRYMGPFNKTIEAAFITNSDIDHFGGFNTLLDHYTIQKLLVPSIADKDGPYLKLLKRFNTKQTQISFIYQNDTIQLGEKAVIDVIWPTKHFIQLNSKMCQPKKIPIAGLKIVCDGINQYSEVFWFHYINGVSILFTGDISKEQLSNYIVDHLKKYRRYKSDLIILKVPHHGSRTGLNTKLLNEIKPELAVISAGRKNRYGHPHKEVLESLSKANINYLVTSKEKDIIINLHTLRLTTQSDISLDLSRLSNTSH